MFKNRFLIVLGVLSLLLVAIVISFPLSNTSTSVERGRAADTARWEAMGVYYLNQSRQERSQTADTARWTAIGEYYEKLEEGQLQRSRVADAARWEAVGEYYLNQSRQERSQTADTGR
jgi:hypothetical protein